ncbi:MAG TPA: DUF2188 domain-containing protein [Janthinobacterium sp.]|jgi:hypothetical protein|nr:DUF2188 domain-containing protein [Janthinobacterium sp.]
MPNIFVEPLPKGDFPAKPHAFQLEFAGSGLTYGPYETQEEAIKAARKMGHKPLVARVRKTDKAIPDHWRAV